VTQSLFGLEQPLELQHLLEDLARSEITGHAAQTRGTESALHRTTDLRTDAHAAMAFVVPQKHAFDLRRTLAVVGQGEKQFLRAVVVPAVNGNFGRPDVELRSQLHPQRVG